MPKVRVHCESCDGTGVDPEDRYSHCIVCNGRGYVLTPLVQTPENRQARVDADIDLLYGPKEGVR
jgi:DnaJ-class molecular chaperone